MPVKCLNQSHFNVDQKQWLLSRLRVLLKLWYEGDDSKLAKELQKMIQEIENG